MTGPLFEVRERDGGFGVWDLRREPARWLEAPGMTNVYWWSCPERAEEYVARRVRAGIPAASSGLLISE